MIKYITIISIIFISVFAAADVYVEGYTKKDGTIVSPHFRTNPNEKFGDNYSEKPNINPYTGKRGTKVTPPKRYKYRPYIKPKRKY